MRLEHHNHWFVFFEPLYLSSHPSKPSKDVVENEPKKISEVSKPRTKSQEFDSENLTQTLESIHVCYKSPS